MDEEAVLQGDDPPSYKATPDLEDPPPSYDSLYGRVKAAKQSSSGTVDFFKSFFIIIGSTIGCTICVGFVLAIPISMIVIGSIYLDDCPREHYIPIYLIVAGVFGLLRNLSSVAQRCKNQHQGNAEENAKANPVDSLVDCFLLAWFIAGNVWIYSIYQDFSTDPAAVDYCNPTLYYFSFWITTLVYIIMLLGCVCVGCTGMIALMCGGRK